MALLGQADGEVSMIDAPLEGNSGWHSSRQNGRARQLTEYEAPASASDVKEKSRGTGLQRALGDLITCPYCMGPWVATALAYGFSKRTRLTRLVAGIFTVTAMSDFLNHALGAVQKLEE
jgi:hypothetical protein